MKKFFYIVLAIFVIALVSSNTSESEFINKIDNSNDPLDEFFSAKHKRKGKYLRENGKYYSALFNLDYGNYGLFSMATVLVGWEGTLRSDGKVLDEFINRETTSSYFIVFGKQFKYNESKNFE